MDEEQQLLPADGLAAGRSKCRPALSFALLGVITALILWVAYLPSPVKHAPATRPVGLSEFSFGKVDMHGSNVQQGNGNTQYNGNVQKKSCEGSGNGVEGVGAAQVVCCTSPHGLSCCAEAAVGTLKDADHVPPNLQAIVQGQANRCPHGTTAKAEDRVLMKVGHWHSSHDNNQFGDHNLQVNPTYVKQTVVRVLGKHETAAASKRVCADIKNGNWLKAHLVSTATAANAVLEPFGVQNAHLIMNLAMGSLFLPQACHMRAQLSADNVRALVEDLQTSIHLKGDQGGFFSKSSAVKVEHPGKCTAYPKKKSPFCYSIGHDHPIPYDIGSHDKVVEVREMSLEAAWSKIQSNDLTKEIVKDQNCKDAFKHSLCLSAFPICDASYSHTPCNMACRALEFCFSSYGHATVDEAKIRHSCNSLCKKPTCGLYSAGCPPQYVLRENAMSIVGDSFQQCCVRSCASFRCDAGYRKIDAAETTPGDSKQSCCQETCALYECPHSMVLKEKAEDIVDVHWNSCCKSSFKAESSKSSFKAESSQAKYLVSCSDDTKGYVYDIDNDFKLVKTLTDAGDYALRSLAFSGKYLASGSFDSKVYVYDIDNDFKLVKTLTAGASVAFSAKYLASCEGGDTNVYVYDIDNDFKLEKTLTDSGEYALRSLAFSGKYLASASDDCKVYVYDIDNDFKLVKTLTDTVNFVSSVAFSGKYLASGSYDDKVYVYDIDNDFKLVKMLTDAVSSLNSVAFSGKYLASGSYDSKVYVYDIDNDFKLVKILSDVGRQVFSVAFSGKYLASGSDDNKVYVYDIDTDFKLVKTLTDAGDHVNNVAFAR